MCIIYRPLVKPRQCNYHGTFTGFELNSCGYVVYYLFFFQYIDLSILLYTTVYVIEAMYYSILLYTIVYHSILYYIIVLDIVCSARYHTIIIHGKEMHI